MTPAVLDYFIVFRLLPLVGLQARTSVSGYLICTLRSFDRNENGLKTDEVRTTSSKYYEYLSLGLPGV